DYEANRTVLQRLLQKAGHRVTVADGGERALDLLADADYDAVVVDLHMPGVSGLDLLRQLRTMQAGAGAPTPVIMLSADVTPEAIQRCTQAGAHAFLSKPVSAARLLDVLAGIAIHPGRRLELAAVDARPGPTANGPFDPSVLDELASLELGAE